MFQGKELEFCLYGIGPQIAGSCIIGISASALDLVIRIPTPFVDNFSAAAKANMDVSIGISAGFIVGGCLLLMVAFAYCMYSDYFVGKISKSAVKNCIAFTIGSIAFASVAVCAHRMYSINLHINTIIHILGNTPEALADIEYTKNVLIAGIVVTLVVGIVCIGYCIAKATNPGFDRENVAENINISTSDNMQNDVMSRIQVIPVGTGINMSTQKV